MHVRQQRFGRNHRRRSIVASAATTSIEEISGAAARTASSTASSSVTADDGQLLQLPLNASRTVDPSGPSVTSSRSHVAAMGAQVRPHPVQRVGYPPVHVVRMQAVHQEQAGHQVVGGQPLGQARVAGRLQLHDPFQPGAVEPDYLADQLLGAFIRGRPTRRAGIQKCLDPIARCTPLRVVSGILGVRRAIRHGSLPDR